MQQCQRPFGGDGFAKQIALPLGAAICLEVCELFGIFDAFTDEAGRQAHLSGPIAQALGENAPNLLAQAPSIERIDVLGTKLP